MKVLFILVCLPLFVLANGQEIEGDWKIHFANLKSEFKAEFQILSNRLEQKESENNLLKERVHMLEKGDEDPSNQSKISAKEKESQRSNVQQKNENANYETLEDRVEKLEELSKIKSLPLHDVM